MQAVEVEVGAHEHHSLHEQSRKQLYGLRNRNSVEGRPQYCPPASEPHEPFHKAPSEPNAASQNRRIVIGRTFGNSDLVAESSCDSDPLVYWDARN
jgi:hypothetical protein